MPKNTKKTYKAWAALNSYEEIIDWGSVFHAKGKQLCIFDKRGSTWDRWKPKWVRCTITLTLPKSQPKRVKK